MRVVGGTCGSTYVHKRIYTYVYSEISFSNFCIGRKGNNVALMTVKNLSRHKL